jgi:hypothetical protein
MCAHRRHCLVSLRRVATGLLFFITPVVASDSYRAVVEDKLLIQPKITSGTLDTINFDQPTMFLTTKRGAAGVAYVYCLATSPLRITDTIAADSSHDFVRALAATLDSHPDPDYLVATDSAVRVMYSEGGGHEKTMQIPGRVRSLAVGASDGHFWVGYARDTAYMNQWFDRYYYCVGGLLDFASVDAPGTEALPGRSAIDLQWRDVDADNQPELVALWNVYGSLTEEAPGSPHLLDKKYWSYGFRAIAADSNVAFGSTIAALTVRGGGSYGYLSFYGSLLIDQGLEHGSWVTFTAATSSGWVVNSGSFYSASLTARTVHSDSVIWTRAGEYGRPFMWDLDADSSPDLLVARVAPPNQPRANIIFSSFTGDSLGVVESEYLLQPWASAAFPDGQRRGLLMSGDTLVVFSISKAVRVNEADELRPDGIVLKGNFPNPFNLSTIIEFEALGRSRVDVVVYDALGRVTARLAATVSASGRYHVDWDGLHHGGFEAPSGVYFYRVTQGAQSACGRMMLLR